MKYILTIISNELHREHVLLFNIKYTNRESQ